ncbi:Protein of unknown function [Pyronema omphalodes CBS 100304]|uniref:Uncharacterized protein n=1 Tax=Pyronema omphalodes (strain CBS 100304) TaxID=1076935 RepID=U4LE12_PYROM|nr:Protein of unknown function [Pyronema omphalodes CBS 100304]
MSIPPPPVEVNTLGLLLRNATSLSATIIKLLQGSNEPVMKDIFGLLQYALDGIIMWEEDAVDLGFHLKVLESDRLHGLYYFPRHIMLSDEDLGIDLYCLSRSKTEDMRKRLLCVPMVVAEDLMVMNRILGWMMGCLRNLREGMVKGEMERLKMIEEMDLEERAAVPLVMVTAPEDRGEKGLEERWEKFEKKLLAPPGDDGWDECF